MENVQEASDVPEPSSSTSCDGSSNAIKNQEEVEEDNKKEKAGKHQKGLKFLARNRRHTRSGSSDTVSSHEERDTKESSPRGVLEDCSTSLDSETASSKASTSDSECQLNSTENHHHRRGFFGMLKDAGSSMRFHTFPPIKRIPKLTRRKSKRYKEDIVPLPKSSLEAELNCFKASWKNFSLGELKTATNDFSEENLIGEGGCAEVYKGQLSDGQFVAVKRLTRGSPEEMATDFLSELGIIVHVDHPNISKLIGYGVDGGMFLILQLSPHGSLASLLYGQREKLDWGTRYKIAVGTAEGLLYLHEGCHRRIIHKDIKASNILLLEDFEPQISDFGLAKWLPDQWSHHTVSKVEGTFGYLPPEFFMHGTVDEKTDVYAFGVLLLEIITGRQALDDSQQSLVMWAKPLLQEDKIKELVDPCLADAYDQNEISRVVFTASLCIHHSPANRPQMSEVLQILRGSEVALEQMKERQNSKKLQRTYSEELLDAEDYNSTKCSSDIDRHMQIVLGTCSDF